MFRAEHLPVGFFREIAMEITSTQNPKIKQLIHLRERSERDQTGLFLIEGYRELLRAVDAGWALIRLFFCPELFLGENENDLIRRITLGGAEVFACPEKVFHKISYRDRPDGLLAIASRKSYSFQDLDDIIRQKKNPLLVVAESIEKPGNLGTILRSSDAVGVDALIVCDRCTDVYNPNVVRASVGTLFTVPTFEAEGDKTLRWLQDNKIKILAATPQAEREFTQADMVQPVAIIVGTEQLGLSARWMDNADIQVRIPMCGVADSLNVAMATTLLMYEALRQRRLYSVMP